MLESGPRRLLLVALVGCLVAVAPLASAAEPPMGGGDPTGGLAPDIDGARADLADALPETGTDADVLHDLIDPEGSEDEEVRQDAQERAPNTGTEADPLVDEALRTDEQTLRSAVVQLRDDTLLLIDDLRRSLPDDPVGQLDDQVRPITASATRVLGPDAYETEPAEPASGSATVVAPAIAPELILAGAGAAAAAAIIAVWLAGSTGTMGAGAGAAGTAGKVAAGDLRRLLPFASPLFTRFEKDTVLGHPKREALYALILQDPGVSLQSLCDATGLSRTAVTHHLRLLEMQHLIVSKRMGRSRHYYENGGRFGRDQKDAYAVLHNGRSKDVARFVKDHPGAIQKELCAALGIQPSIAHWHLRRLQQAQLVEAVRQGRTVSYFPGPALANLDRAPVGTPAPEPAPVPAPVAVPLRLNVPLSA